MVFLIISINFFGFCDAPPIKKPSMLGILFKVSALLVFTDPPYKILGYFFTNLLFINEIVSIKAAYFGITPVPIDHTGS
jgi:hypothetical protein